MSIIYLSVRGTDHNCFGLSIGYVFPINKAIYEDVQIWRKVSSITLPSQSPALHVEDHKASGTNGGTFTSGAWRTRDLNTVATNEISGASLATNQITLPAGTYKINARAPAFQVQPHTARLFNIAGSAVLLEGSTEGSWSTSGVTNSKIIGKFTLTVSSNLEIQHYGKSTILTNGFGQTAAIVGKNEVYTQVYIEKLS